MAFNVFGKNSGNKDSLPATNPQQSSSILGAAGFAFKTNSPGIKSFSTEKIFHNSRPLNSEIDEGSDSSEDEDDETTGSDSDDSVTRENRLSQNPISKIRITIKSVRSSKSDFVSGTTANLQKKKVNNMMTTEEQSYNRSDIRSDVSWGNDPCQQQQSSRQVKSPTVKINPNFIIEGQGFTPKLSFYINNNATFLSLYKYNEWSTKSFDSRLEIMYGGRDNDKVVSSRHINPIIRNPRTEASNYDNPGYPSYGGNLYQRKPTVQVSARIPYSIDESTSYSGARKVSSFAQLNKDDEDNLRKLLELHLSNKELLTLNKSLEEQISEQSSELENLSSLNLTTKLSEQETQIKTIKDDDNEENKKTKATLFYDPRNLPLHTLPRIIFDRVYDDLSILYLVIKSLLYTFYIFPILIFFRVTKKVYEKSKIKFMEITAE
ncbi:unnamed protein product [Rhizophagus irregularis]|nr:unnamed protein product [Rhizophagus irregularis]